MADDAVEPDQLPPPPASAKRRIPVGAKVFLGVVALVVVVGGFFFARALWWSMRPTPDFPSLAEAPDPSLTGTVAFLKPSDECVYLVAASGGEPKKLACIEGGPGELSWTPDGKIQSTRYEGGEGTGDTASWIIDPETGDIETVATDEIPPQPYDPEGERPEPKGPNGETVTCKSSNGKLTLTLNTEAGERTLLSVDAPDTYCMGVQAWNPDGNWFVVKDDLDRLLLVTTDDPSTTRVLVDGGYWPAYTDADVLSG